MCVCVGEGKQGQSNTVQNIQSCGKHFKESVFLIAMSFFLQSLSHTSPATKDFISTLSFNAHKFPIQFGPVTIPHLQKQLLVTVLVCCPVICPMHFIPILKINELRLGEVAPRFMPRQYDSKAGCEPPTTPSLPGQPRGARQVTWLMQNWSQSQRVYNLIGRNKISM